MTFRWIKQHVSSCPFLKAGVACCLPTCAQGSSVLVTVNFGIARFFWAFMFLFGALCILVVLALLVYTKLCTGLGSRWCASCWTRPLGEGRWGYYHRDFWRESMAAHNTATHFYSFCFFRTGDVCRYGMPYKQALAGQPSLLSYDASMVYWAQEALRRICRQKQCETSFAPFFGFFCLVGILRLGSGI